MLVNVLSENTKHTIQQGASEKLWPNLNFFLNSATYLAACQNETSPLPATIIQIHSSISTRNIPKEVKQQCHQTSHIHQCGFRV